MQPKVKRVTKTRRLAEVFLLLVGVAGLGAWLLSMALPVVWQDWENWVFDHELVGQEVTFRSYLEAKQEQFAQDIASWLGLAKPPRRTEEPPPATAKAGPSGVAPRVQNNALVGRLAIPRLRLSSIVREGVTEGTLGLAVGHIPGTALPGQNGNVGVAGHRDTLFRGLASIHKNDLIHLDTLDGSYVYAVGSIQIVKPKDVDVLKPGRYPELTLVTCYPFNYVGSAPDRFIVKARQISSEVRSAKVPPAAAQPVAQVIPAEPAPPKPITPNPTPAPTPVPGRVTFDLARGHSRTLAPGISLGVDDINAQDQKMNGWMWLLHDRRTIWLKNQGTHDPVEIQSVFDGKKRELVITSVTPGAVSGYLILPN